MTNPLAEVARAPVAVVGTSIPNCAVVTEGAACAAAGTSSARASDNRTERTFAGEVREPGGGVPALSDITFEAKLNGVLSKLPA